MPASVTRRLGFLALLASWLCAPAAHAQVGPIGGEITEFPYLVSRLLADPARPRVYVADYGTNRIIVIDTATLTAAATVSVGPKPVDLSISPDGGTLYVASNGAASAAISVIDLDALTVRATFPLPRKIAGIAAGLNGRVYASGTSSDGSVVYQLDGATGAVQGTFGGGKSVNSFLGITPDRTTLFFATGNTKSDLQSFDVSTATPAVRQTVHNVQASGGQLVVGNTGKYVVLPYATGTASTPFGETDVYSAADITHQDAALAGDDYGGVLAFNADDSLLYQIREDESAVLDVYDTATFQIVASSRSGIPYFDTGEAGGYFGDSYGSLAIDHTGSYVFVSDFFASDVVGNTTPARSRLLVLASGAGTMKPAVPTVTFAAFAQSDGPGAGSISTLAVHRVGDLTKKLVAHYTLAGSAQSGVNFQPLSGTVKFKPGQESATITITPIGPISTSAYTTLKLRLTPSANYRRGEHTRISVSFDY